MEKRFTTEEASERILALLGQAGIRGVELRFEQSGVHIKNSCEVRSRALREAACRILSVTEGFERTPADMSAEWLGHNAYYRLTRHPGAKNADIECRGDKRWYVRLAARLMGRLGLR